MNGMMKKNQLIVVKEYEIIKPATHEIDSLLDDVIKDSRNKYFHTFECKPVYCIKFTKISNNEEVIFTNTHRSMELKTEFYGLNKKIKNDRRNAFISNQKKVNNKNI